MTEISTEKPVVEVKNFKMRFGTTEVIKNLNFEIYKGEVFGLLGSNGSGKTTTVRSLLGLYEPTAGELLIDGKVFAPETNITIGYLPEERGLYKKEKVKNVMAYFAELKGLDKISIDPWIKTYLRRVDLSDHYNTRLDKLSSGQQQKVQLGITIMGHPELLILDEPTKGFDPINRKLLLDIVEEERANGATVMMITHQMEEAERLCDRVLLLKDGEARVYGRVEDIKDKAGKDRIRVTFNGLLPTNPSLYKIVSSSKNQAELDPISGIDNNQIVSFLIDQNTNIRSYSIERPSLDDIFVSIYGTKVVGETEGELNA